MITGDLPMGVTPDYAQLQLRLLLLVNDVSLRKLVAPELAKASAFCN